MGDGYKVRIKSISDDKIEYSLAKEKIKTEVGDIIVDNGKTDNITHDISDLNKVDEGEVVGISEEDYNDIRKSPLFVNKF